MSAWLVLGLIALAAGLALYATVGAAGSRAATPVAFRAVMPVSEPIAADGYRTLGPLHAGEHVAGDSEAGRVVVTLVDGIVSINAGTSAWAASAGALLDAAAGQPPAGGVPLEVPFERRDEEGSARALVYEVRGMAGGDAPRLDAAAFWLIVPEAAFPVKPR